MNLEQPGIIYSEVLIENIPKTFAWYAVRIIPKSRRPLIWHYGNLRQIKHSEVIYNTFKRFCVPFELSKRFWHGPFPFPQEKDFPGTSICKECILAVKDIEKEKKTST